MAAEAPAAPAGKKRKATEPSGPTHQQLFDMARTIYSRSDAARKDGGMPAADFHGLCKCLAKLSGSSLSQGVISTYMKENMGAGVRKEWTRFDESNDKKTSLHWSARVQDGSIVCSGSAETLQRLFQLLLDGNFVTGEYAQWQSKISIDTFSKLLKVDPWVGTVRAADKVKKDKENEEKTDTPSKKQTAAQKTEDGGSSSADNGTKSTKPFGDADDAEPAVVVFSSPSKAATAADKQLAVLRQHARGDREAAARVAELEGALDFFRERGSGAAAAASAAPDAGMAWAIEGDVLTYEFPGLEDTKVGVKSTPHRKHFQLIVINEEVLPAGCSLTSMQNNIFGLQPGVRETEQLTVPDGRELLDIAPSEEVQSKRRADKKKPLKPAPLGQTFYNKQTRRVQYGMPLVHTSDCEDDDDENDGYRM